MEKYITVITPSYNRGYILPKLKESLIEQTNKNFIWILVNDGSTDNSLTIAQDYAAQDARIAIYSQTNRGQAAARNNGLQYANGEWIAFVDADDYLDTDCYAQLMQHIAHNDCVQMGYRRISTDGKIIEEKCPRYFYQFTSPCMRLYRRDLFTKHQLTFPEGMIYEDVIFSLDFWATNPTFISLPYTGYNYTFNPLSTTAKRNRTREKELFEVLNAKLRHAHSFKLWCITLLTIIRLKLHFMRYE